MNPLRKLKSARDLYLLYGFSESCAIVVQKILGLSTGKFGGLNWRSGGRSLDRKLGIRTNEFIDKEKSGVPEGSVETSEHHVAVNPRVFRSALAATGVDFPDFVFVDVGSGLGRAVILATRFGFKKIIGVEISKKLNDRAIENLVTFSKKAGKTPCELLNMDALDYELPNQNLCIHINRPFSHELMAAFLEKIERSLSECPRKIVVVSVFLFEPWVFEKAPSLKLTKQTLFHDRLHRSFTKKGGIDTGRYKELMFICISFYPVWPKFK